MLIANPICGLVFKYLLEDNKVAKTFLSALLKREVVASATGLDSETVSTMQALNED